MPIKVVDHPPRLVRRLKQASEIKKHLTRALESLNPPVGPLPKKFGSEMGWVCRFVDALIFDLERDIDDDKKSPPTRDLPVLSTEEAGKMKSFKDLPKILAARKKKKT